MTHEIDPSWKLKLWICFHLESNPWWTKWTEPTSHNNFYWQFPIKVQFKINYLNPKKWRNRNFFFSNEITFKLKFLLIFKMTLKRGLTWPATSLSTFIGILYYVHCHHTSLPLPPLPPLSLSSLSLSLFFFSLQLSSYQFTDEIHPPKMYSLSPPPFSPLSKMRAQTWLASPMLEIFYIFEWWKTSAETQKRWFDFVFLMKSLKNIFSGRNLCLGQGPISWFG